MTWDPATYLQFREPRLRAARDLLARIEARSPAAIYDLGCGTGNATALLRQRWPDATITGIDSSRAMLARAEAEHPDVRWIEGDIGSWSPPAPADLIFSNAALHWLDDHDRVLPGLVSALREGGVLAAQMPRNFAAPSHTCLAEAVREGPWRARLEPMLRPAPVEAPEDYHAILSPACRRVDIWETEYLHVLDGEDPVVAWARGTSLGRLLAALDEDERKAFEAAYAERIRRAYPPRADGRTLFPFRRLFIVAER